MKELIITVALSFFLIILGTSSCKDTTSTTIERNGIALPYDSNTQHYKSLSSIGHHSEIYEVIYKRDTFLVILSNEGFHSSIIEK